LADTRNCHTLLRQAKAAAVTAGRRLVDLRREGRLNHDLDPIWTREVKAEADKIIERLLVEELSSTGLPMLSEESGELSKNGDTDLRFILDPIDGTANFIRGIGESSISIALFKGEEPVFGVMFLHPSGQLAWGGPDFGSFIDNQPICVSTVQQESRAVLCTGIPARFDLTDKTLRDVFIGRMLKFSKIRMLGAASISLLHVAKGSADCYAEHDVMIWDIAAGLAMVCGSGGAYKLSPGAHEHSRHVIAHNGKLA